MHILIGIILLCAGQIKILLDRQEKLYERQCELKALLDSCKTSEDVIKDDSEDIVENWSGSFEWDSQADDVKFNIFGISTYRSNQKEVGAF